MSLIDVENLSVRYGNKTVLSHVDLTIESGEIVTIVGPNGSGKTSLFRAIIGSTEASSGQITKEPGLRIGYVPQKLHIDPTLTITVERRTVRRAVSACASRARFACQTRRAFARRGDARS